MNKQAKFYLELIDLREDYKKKLHSTNQMRFIYKIEAINKAIEIYKNN